MKTGGTGSWSPDSENVSQALSPLKSLGGSYDVVLYYVSQRIGFIVEH